jgi:hypothetical protein
MNGFTAIATKNAVTIERNGKKIEIPVTELSNDRIAKALEELGIDELFPQTKKDARFAVDNKGATRPTLVSVERNQPRYGQIKLKTMNPQKTAVVTNPIDPKAWDATFQSLEINADDYYAHLEFLKKNGLPQPANKNLIGTVEREGLVLGDLNEFNYPVTGAVETSLFVDEKIANDDLFEFELDTEIFQTTPEIRESIRQLFEFDAEKKKQKN